METATNGVGHNHTLMEMPVLLDGAENDAPDMEDDEQVLRAAQRAVAKTLRDHKARGQYVVGWVEGKIVHIQPEDIVVPDVD